MRPALLVLLMLVLSGGPAGAAKAPDWMVAVDPEAAVAEFPDEDVILLYTLCELEVKKSGKKEFRYRDVYYVKNGDGGPYRSMTFSESYWRKMKKLRAWHRDARGDVKKVDKLSTSQLDAAVYTETKEFTLRVPSVGPGSLFAFELEHKSSLVEESIAWFPAQFKIPAYRWEFRLKLPEGWQTDAFWVDRMSGDALPVDPDRVGEEKGERIWVRENLAAAPEDEPFQPPWKALREVLVVDYHDPRAGNAAGGDWRSLSRWYREFTESSLQDQAGLDELALEVLDGSESFDEKVTRVADFVRSSITYVQIYLKDGGYRPHPIMSVYENRYGDCKDMAHLAIGLLRSSGLHAYPVLTNVESDNLIWPDLPARQFDHCIVAVAKDDDPGGLVHFDPTAKTIPYGRLPAALEGAWALVIGVEGDSALRKLPRSGSLDNQTLYSARVTVSPDLVASGTVEETLIGQTAFAYRSWLLERDAEEHLERWQAALEQDLKGAKVRDLSVERLDEIGDTLKISYRFEVAGFGRTLGKRVLLQPDFLTCSSSAAFNDPERTRDIVFDYPSCVTTDIRVQWPPGWEATEIPGAVELQNAFGQYSRRMEVENGGLRLTRRSEIYAARFDPENYSEAREWDQIRYTSDQKRVVVLRE